MKVGAMIMAAGFCGLLIGADPAPVTVGKVLDAQLGNVEREVVSLAEAMPEDKYGFAPTQGEFKGVRTFAEQAKHIGSTNWGVCASGMGEKPPAAAGDDEKGPVAVKTKTQIVQYLKDSFAYCHKAELMMTKDNATDLLEKRTRLSWLNIPIWHTFDHYGQMVEYARMNGIVPPASRH